MSSFPGPPKLRTSEGGSWTVEVAAQTARTVWDGVYTEAQAERGRAAYSQSCTACHCEDLRGDGTAPSLVGESFAFLWGDMTVGELFTRTRAIIPPERPGSLSPQGYVDIIAFILKKDAFPTGETELGIDRDALQQISPTPFAPYLPTSSGTSIQDDVDLGHVRGVRSGRLSQEVGTEVVVRPGRSRLLSM